MSANGQGVSFWSNKDALEVGNGDVEKLSKHTKTTELHSLKMDFREWELYTKKGKREERKDKKNNNKKKKEQEG